MRTRTAIAFLLLSIAASPATGARPVAGQAQRHAILEALRLTGDDPDRRFVVRTLRVAGAWAWVLADPQSPDGGQHYEAEAALLHRAAGGWAVIDRPCSEEGCDWAAELARIRRSHPSAPASLFRS